MDTQASFPGFFYGDCMPFKISDVERFKKGLTKKQKERWISIANSVLEKCIKDGGTTSTCDGSAIRQANGAVNNNMKLLLQSSQLKNYSIRDEIHQGKDYLVMPVIMLVEGIYSPANGVNTLWLPEEYGKIPKSWNGIPVTVNHPQEVNGIYVPASDPEIIEKETIGIIYNTILENGKLKAEAWIERKKTQELYPELLNTLLSGSPLEISTGSFFELDDNPGEIKGQSYNGTARNFVPNHLALLPNDTGACSWNAGCGIRANKGGDELKKEIVTAMKTLNKEGFAIIQCNELGFRETSSKIQMKLDGMDTDVKFHNLQEVFGDEFVYSVFGSSDEQLLKRGYTVNADETIEFTGEPIPVTRSVEFKEITANKGKGVNAMSKEKSKSCCPAKVDLLIMSGRFDKTDEWLNDLNESALDKLLSDKEKVQVNRNEALAVLSEDLSSPDKLVSILSGDAKSIVEHGLALNQEERKKLIDHISTNAGGEDGYTAEDLNAKDTAELKKLAGMVKTPADFSGLSVGSNINTIQEEGLYPMARPTQKTQ